MFWGFSEAIDLYEEYIKNVKSNPEHINILLFGNSDSRNILKTLAKSYTHNVQLNIYVIDGVIELIARNILLLTIALEQPEVIPLKNKVHLFMDIYGNTLLRPSSYNYIASKATSLIKILTDSDHLENIAPIFNIDNLKYRERDSIEEVFNFWLSKSEHVFKIEEYWNARLRKTLGARYDHSDGVFDWDLQMRLKDNNVKQICTQEYRHWRKTGVAFTFPEYEQSQPNKSLVTGLIRNGTKYLHRGYVGDMEIGPYCAFGLKAPEEKMNESHHGVNSYRATDVAERNLFEIFYEIEEKKPYVHDDMNTHKFGGVCFDLGKNLPSCIDDSVELEKFEKSLICFPRVKIYFLSLNDIYSMQEGGGGEAGGNKFQKQFDVIFVACNYFAFLKKQFANIFAEEALILFETKQYTLCKKDDINEFLDKIKAFAKELNLKNVTNFNVNLKYSIVKFKCDNNSEYSDQGDENTEE